MSRTSGLMRSMSSTRTPGRTSLTDEGLHRHRLTSRHVSPVFLQHDQTVSGDHRRQDARALRPGRPDLPSAVGVLEDAALELPPARLLAHRLHRARLPGLGEQSTATGQLEERRAHEQHEGQRRSHGVARQPEEVSVADPADGERPSRLHGHLPEVDAADLAEHGLDQVVDTHRDAAGRDHHVGDAAGFEQLSAQDVALVGHDPEIGHAPATLLDEAAQREAIGVVDLTRLARRSRLGHLVAGGEQGDARTLSDEHLSVPERREQSQLLRAEHAAAGYHDGAGHHVFTTPPHIGGALDGPDPHARSTAFHELLRIHRVGAGRNRRARHDAHGLSGGERAGEHGAGRQIGDDGEIARAARGNVGGHHGVSVDGGIVGGRHVEGRARVLDEDTTEGSGERKNFRSGAAIDLGEDAILPIPHRNHAAYYTDAVSTVLARETPRPAGFWIRGAALLIDFVIFYIAEHSFRFAAYRLWGEDVRDFDSGDATLVVRVLADVFTLVFAGVYTTVLHTMDGQTIGKMLMGVRVVGADGAPLPIGAALLRYFAYFVSAAPLGMGFIMAGLRRDKRGLHDLVAGSRVDRLRARPRARAVPPPSPASMTPR